ncbi:MAG: cyoA [Acidimicrobiales bacterium]|nr:cyoA [Acidimicrobiales bacterium]
MPSRARLQRVALVVVSMAMLTACELPRFGAPDPAAKQGRDIQRLWSGFFVGAAVVVAIVWGLLIWVLLRYRRRDGDDSLPPQRAYNIPVEVAYTAIPLVVVGILFGLSVVTQRRVTRVVAKPAQTVDVIGFQWGWEFRYPGTGVTVVEAEPGRPPEMVLPLGEPTRLRLRSTDVNHAFWVPRFLDKRDLIPGVRNEIDVTPTKAGTYVGRCAEFCGLDHWAMYFSVRVVPHADYQSWLQRQKKGSGP